MRGAIAPLVLMLLAAVGAPAQGAADLPAFDVASVKPSLPVAPGQNININLGTARHGEVTLTNTNLSDCIRFAYELVSEAQIAGPDWLRSYELRYDIDAKAPPDTPRDRLLLMLQRLLAERFQLALHREPRPIAHLELQVAKSGLKLHASQDGAAAGRRYYGRGRLSYDGISIHTLAVLLSRQLRQPVLDKTGLEGTFDVNLEWTPDDPPSPAGEPSGLTLHPDIFGAVQSQLGLKLEMRKTPLEVLVVDRAEKVPAAN